MVILYINLNGRNIKCVFFGQGYIKYNIRKGMFVTICGTYKIIDKEIVGYKILDSDNDIYIDIDYKSELKNSLISKLISQIYNLDFQLDDNIPAYLREKYRLLDYFDFIYKSHFPKSLNDIKQIIRRKKYIEFLNYCTSLRLLEDSVLKIKKTERKIDKCFIDNFISNLPYKLTFGQENVINDIILDIKSNHIMNRLIEGDVGSGKTIISFISMLLEIRSGYQVLLMAPTEILAKQHYEKFIKLTRNLNIETRLLTSNIKKQYVDETIDGLNSGRINCLISTQAVLYRNDLFNNLGLIVIDEQHRFGVEQRSKLLNYYKNVDALYLSATPIPRTLGLTQFGDLALSELREKPNGRKDIKTKIININELFDLKNKIHEEINNKHQIFVVVSQIEDGFMDLYDLNSAEKLFKEIVPEARIAKINGKINEKLKDKIMNDFSNHEYDILISTTVIEVGIDIKDATLMFILDSDRFGLSTIHQLRGRVGRNNLDSYCYLVTKNINNERLKSLEKTNDCFELAEIDLKLRGPGDILGNLQSGFINLDFGADYNIYKCALEDSLDLVLNHNDLDYIKILKDKLLEKNNKLN
jgi:ATP-dependent DNA helicase RecG